MKLAALLSESAEAFETPRSLYIHIPFCSSRCAYCDFHSFPRSSILASSIAAYIDSVLKRTEALCEATAAQIETIYIGGGTPTILSDAVFDRLLGGLRAIVGTDLHEWTVEANPESLTPEKIGIMVANKVSRISIGIQSMDDEALKVLGRGARSADNRRAAALAAGSGLALSADLIAALPEAKDDPKAPARLGELGRKAEKRKSHALSESVNFLVDQGFGHISIYDLVVEEGTRIKKRLDDGELLLADEDQAFDERREAERLLDRLGYRRYEVSNYCLPGRESLHNGAYWAMNSYLGIGSGAVSTLIVRDEEKIREIHGGSSAALRIEEGKNLSSYIENPDKTCALEWLGRGNSAFEMVMMGLRTSKGLDETRFRSRFGLEASMVMAKTLRKWKDHFSDNQGYLSLDGSGLDILNGILVDALEEMIPHFPEKAGTAE